MRESEHVTCVLPIVLLDNGGTERETVGVWGEASAMLRVRHGDLKMKFCIGLESVVQLQKAWW